MWNAAERCAERRGVDDRAVDAVGRGVFEVGGEAEWRVDRSQGIGRV